VSFDFVNATETVGVLTVFGVLILAWSVIAEDEAAAKVALIFLGLCSLAALALTILWIWTT